MCGRYCIIPDDIIKRYNLINKTVVLEANYNAAPGQYLPVIIKVDEGNELKLMKWGLVPSWSKDQSISYKMINAKSETILEKPSFKGPFNRTRCLVPVTGFYEWKKLNDKYKLPFFIHLKEQKMMSLAGIYDIWVNPQTEEEILSFSIITTDANSQVREIHNRMPVILDSKEQIKYLEGSTEEALGLLKPSTEKLEIYEVSKLVNTPKNNLSELMDPVTDNGEIVNSK